MRYLLFCSFFIIRLSSAAELAKIFKDGMVLQATPTIAKIWGWQEGDPNDWPPIDITTNCELNGKKFQTKMRYVHNKVKCNPNTHQNLLQKLILHNYFNPHICPSL